MIEFSMRNEIHYYKIYAQDLEKMWCLCDGDDGFRASNAPATARPGCLSVTCPNNILTLGTR